MATRDTGGQQRPAKRTEEVEETAPEAQESSDLAERKEKLDDDIDAILDEIDEVIESNSEEYVRGVHPEGRPVTARHS
jgi:ubiquitin-like protein Pup